MPDRWQTYPIEFAGGLISNLSPLQHGASMPGSARVLTNFEPSIEGGYRRIEGFEKFNTNTVTGQSEILGVEFYRGAAIVARDQSSSNPKLYAVPSGSGSHTDLSTSITLGANTSRVRFANFNFNGTEKLFIVDGKGFPVILESLAASGLSQLSSSNGSTDINGASHVAIFKDHIFVSNGRKVVFSVPFDETDFTTANGAGIIDVGSNVTGLVSFREQLIIFSESKINRLVGNSAGDFQVQPIASDIGCIAGETIQEISGDIIFLAPDGLRTLAGTERNQDFSLASISKPIQNELVSLTSVNTAFPSVVIREKSQYRVFGYEASTSANTSKGIIGTQLQGRQGLQINWAETIGIKAYAATSKYVGKVETVLFVNEDGYVYKMESGNGFDGSDITASFSTPYFPITDPQTRKTIYRSTIYCDPQGSVDLDFNVKYDLSAPDVIEPETINFSNVSSSSTVSLYNSQARFAHGGLINNSGGYSAGVTSMAVDELSSSDIISGDTFQIIVSNSSSANFEKTYTLTSTPSISNEAGTLSFSPALAADVADNASIIFLKLNGENFFSTFSGESLQSIFDSQTQGSGFTVSLQFESQGTNPPFSLDTTVLEYGQYGRR